MAPPTKGDATRRRLTESMLQHIHATGYHGAGLNAVVEAAGAPKGSLYFHFPGGKSELGSSAIALVGEEFGAAIQQALETTDSPDELVAAVVGQLSAQLIGSDYRVACPVAAVTLDAAADDERLRLACSDAYASWVTLLEQHLVATSGASADAAHRTAVAVVSLIEGALVMCRAQRSIEPLEAASPALTLILGSASGRETRR
jgi:TetR/AcrR family transcriptional regulator, lmrAB and yxaGH operons repressor